MHSWVLGANANLPTDASLIWAKPVDDEFHARFSAIARSYSYIILNRPARSGLYHPLLAWESRPLDVSLMSEAARHLVGKHDFTSYRAKACQSHSAVREIHDLKIERRGSYVIINVRANAFLYHMVRNIAGILIALGIRKEKVDWAGQVLEARNRAVAGVTARPEGLYLTNVEYPERFEIPSADKFNFHSPAWSVKKRVKSGDDGI